MQEDATRSTSTRLDVSRVPGVVIAHSPASTGEYIGSPSIVIMPDGSYVASHDLFGPGSTQSDMVVYRSPDRGLTWALSAYVTGQWWSTLFSHGGELFLLGTSCANGRISIRRSADGGATWTVPHSAEDGFLSEDEGYHCAPTPVIRHQGRIWRAFEAYNDRDDSGNWFGKSCSAFVVSAPLNSDLLRADSWTWSNSLPHPGKDRTSRDRLAYWREGNVVLDRRSGELKNVIRYEPEEPNKAAIIHVGSDGRTLSFNQAEDVIDLPGGRSKFTIRYDASSSLYWSLTNPFFKDFADLGYMPTTINGGRGRNVQALVTSPDLLEWTIRAFALKHSDFSTHAFQYVDWQFDGDDIVFVSRTGFEDGLGGAHRPHDANMLTFHRIRDFRSYADATPISTDAALDATQPLLS